MLTRRSTKEDTKTIVFGSVIATGALAVIVFIVVICWQIRRKAADYADEESIDYNQTSPNHAPSSSVEDKHNRQRRTSYNSSRSSGSSFFNNSSSWFDRDFSQLMNKDGNVSKGVRFSENVNDDGDSPLSEENTHRWSFEPDTRSSLAYLNHLPHRPKPVAKQNHLTLMIDKDVVQDVLPGYYKDEDSVYNIYHERCKSLK
ncbi:hypothetical protein E3Q23_03547 [Wallemia mellicola]|uniref:Uncharacterized protein n=1 Tax=Wallemia mellicola TaxID=1708541 RepID=A0A4T0TCR9_9BASI|nr:hypothetical protein E3Q23_03547 [Wallemia mellicola]TIB87891.1 hypothetical protein E3Q19_03511 [Wallemia mellicola]TIC09451.1 hypothetical protein E3Q15_03522 [Wallemia mellicola]TIC25400.1 hypothetical protein E3Q11_03395 [Wallemia mellicola]TIC50713.1 hypothetical protein E3Q05_03379 [Wallemia mellicola]